jgi:hypothetical protein
VIAQIDVPSSISTLEGSLPRNLRRCATTSSAMVSKSRTLFDRSPVRTSLKDSQNFDDCSEECSEGEPRVERIESSMES